MNRRLHRSARRGLIARNTHPPETDAWLPGQAHPRPEERLAAAGYAWQAWAENLAAGRAPSEVVARWMASPEHHANILNPNYTETGVGFVANGSGPGYYVQVFGRRRS